jgi:ABC-type Fe3+-hydroxamate transport system substrate-binding protein
VREDGREVAAAERLATLADDLGHSLSLTGPPRRIVSLVPSLTEALAVSVPDRLVGVTDWCTHPPGLDRPRVRGTKNPSRAAIAALNPDLVVANREENRRYDVERLRAAGIPVWVTEIESVDAALGSLRRLFTDVLSVPEPGWLQSAVSRWAEPPPLPPLPTIVPIWRDPWMVVGARTFTGDLLARLGLVHLFAGSPDRYPRLELSDLTAAGADLVILPDEPYCFTATDGPEAFPGTTVALVPGRSLTWYGPSLASARDELVDRVRSALDSRGRRR